MDEVVKLWDKCGLTVPWNNPVEDIKLKMNFQPELFFIAKIKDKVVGTVMAGYEGHRGWINYLAVDPEYQRMGIGKKLMTYCEQVLGTMGCVKVNLQVRKSNKDVIYFYEHIGYKNDQVISFGKRLKAAAKRENMT